MQRCVPTDFLSHVFSDEYNKIVEMISALSYVSVSLSLVPIIYKSMAIYVFTYVLFIHTIMYVWPLQC